MTALTLLTLPPSPYNTKVRLALKLKEIDYESTEVGFGDRTEVIARSGQPLTPVLLDGDRVIYDSFGILRYLDANFGGPKLFSEDRAQQREIQDWENYSKEFDKAFGPIVGQALGGVVDDAATADSQALYRKLTERVEAALENSPYLMGERPNAADLSIGPFYGFAILEPEDVPEGFMRFVVERVTLDERFLRTREWARRVMEIDAAPVA